METSSVMLCTVYRCSRESDMYIYVNRAEGLSRVPEDLQQRTGALSEVLTMKLVPDRKLARASAPEVLKAIAEKGFYLQLPPNKQPTQFTMGE